MTRPFHFALLLALAAFIGLHRIAPNSWLSFHTDMRLDALLVPAAMAVLLHSPHVRQRLTPALRLWPILALLLPALPPSWFPAGSPPLRKCTSALGMA